MKQTNKKLSRHTVRHDVFDRAAYDNVFVQSKELQAMVTNGGILLATVGELSADIFFSLYKTMPELIPVREVMPEYLFNQAQMAKMLESPAYQELRQYTQCDEFGAGLGSKALLEALVNQLQEDVQLRQAVQKVNYAVERKREAELLDNHTEEAQRALAAVKAAMDDVKAVLASNQSVVRKAGDSAISAATLELEATESVIMAWGLQQGEFNRLPYDKKANLITILRGQQKFRDMTKLVGRMRNIAAASRKVKLEQRLELHSITQGSDINHMLHQELLSLRKPSLKLDFYRKMTERQLMQYDLRQTDYRGQGPVLALVDTSGSMRGEREVWSKAVAVGLAEIAERERRAFGYALFASKHRELITDIFPAGKRPPDKLLKLATEFLGGGTDYEQPLRWAMQQLQTGGFAKADVVLITDGECRLSDVFLQELHKLKAEKQFRIYSLLIGSSACELKLWSDAVWHIADLLDESIVKELFQKI
ncbi:VWA domain-containing protein [Sporomusa sphaeroides]|uniref:VWFA domain-containing protein n=1 Tax=Sporomusa sphaeroides DSM 2875 TaxID=1337886 RepID=A0ABP2C8I0_9FIRM|nr:VWA domain-containing protein [Sporomusa sphaeroides]OLS56318.1 protein ViaA [Sporomusa sphaeroides DSM 2875]CVK18413.1 hypothetical protein SSPH_01051 [Sporomusa sphaeroides DSM 2875]